MLAKRRAACASFLSAVCFAIGAAFPADATAQATTNANPASVMLERLRQDAAVLAKLGNNAEVKQINIVDTQRSGPMSFDFARARPVVPGNMVLQDFTAINCTAVGINQRVSVSRTSQQTESFSTTDSYQGSARMELSLDSPIIQMQSERSVSVSSTSSSSINRSYEQTWNSEIEVPIPAGRKFRVQFQVETRQYKDVPWTADLEVKGPVQVAYTTDMEACLFSELDFKGAKRCWTAKAGQTVFVSDLTFERFDNGLGIALGIGNSKVASLQTRGAGYSRVSRLPGLKGQSYTFKTATNVPDLAALEPNTNWRRQVAALQLSSMQKGLELPASELLPNLAQRTLRINGLYQGVSGAEGVWRATDDGPATCNRSPARDTAAPAPTLTQNDPNTAGAISGNVLARVKPR